MSKSSSLTNQMLIHRVWTYRYGTYRYDSGLIVTVVDLSLRFFCNQFSWTYRYDSGLIVTIFLKNLPLRFFCNEV